MTNHGAAVADNFGRRFRYLRLSVTEVCNFRCTYCLPDGYRKSGPMDFLAPAEVERLVRVFAQLGIRKVRLTGGEPTVRKDLAQLIACVSAQTGIDKVALTTNGWNLSRHVDEWVDAGLTNLNVSMDALDREAFHRITGHDPLNAVLSGLEHAPSLALN